MTNRYPEAVVGCFIRNGQGDLLIVRSPKWGNGAVWSVPGGHVEMGETVAAAAVREAAEEIGLTVTFIRVFSVVDGISLPQFHEDRHFIFLECECTVAGTPRAQPDGREIIEARWASRGDIDRLPVMAQARDSASLLFAAGATGRS